MFAGFNLTIDLDSFKEMIKRDKYDFYFYKLYGEAVLGKQKAKCNDELKQYVTNGTVDGTKLEEDWFPQIKADVFISHSHKDTDLASALAGWLNDKFGITCFIDSHVWGYINDLFKMINKDSWYLTNNEEYLAAASHVNMMLCIALQKMIDKAEAVIVINTENSIKKYEDIYDKSTYSPWIYSEIVCTQIVRNKELSEYRKGSKVYFSEATESQKHINESYQAAYKVSLDHLKDINTSNLTEWALNWSKVSNRQNRYSLDELYKITHPQKVKQLIAMHNIISGIL